MSEPIFGREMRAAAQRAVNHSIRDIVRAESGDDGFTERPMFHGAQTMTITPKAAAAVRAALLLHNQTRGKLHDSIRAVRAEGGTWERVAELLGLPKEDDGGGSAAERAFYTVAPQDGGCSSSTASWRCGSCHAYVSDNGPFNSHPTDNENGHASTCARHNAAVAAYEAEWEDA